MRKNNTKKPKRKGSFLIVMGLLLIAAALSLSLYNYVEGNRAYEAAVDVAGKLKEQIPTGEAWNGDYDPYRPMPTIEVDGFRYIGILEVPSLDISLPVMEEWDYDRLKISPCRYSGSYYANDLVIAGHNYARHFSPVKWVELGSDVYFINVEGAAYHYRVDYTETLQPEQIEEMTTGEWDLTLFTCNTGGQSRRAVRCRKAG